MTDLTSFDGYPREGLEFLTELAENNDRDWFKERKAVFEEHVQKPTQAFVVALGQRLQVISSGISYDTRLVGGSIMRIYRDVRFSKDKTPYHTKVRLVFWEGPSRKAMHSGFHVRIDPSGAGVFVGHWELDKSLLARFRDAVVDDIMGAELQAAIEAVRQSGDYTVGGEHYKRVPLGYDKEHPRAGLLLHKGLWAHTESVAPSYLTTPELADVCFEHCRNMAPIHHWLMKLAKS